MSSTLQSSPSATPSNCQYGYCGNSCLETSSSICCTGGNSGNSSGTVQCGNGWACSTTSGYCCPKANQEYCSGADECIDATSGQSCCGPTWCPQNQTCASSGDRCCPNSQTVCATDWWFPVSTSITVISMTTTPTAHPTTSTSIGPSTTSAATKSNTPSSVPSSTNLSTGAKAGIAVGTIFGAIAIVGLILLLLKKWNRSNGRSRPMYAPAAHSEYGAETATAYNYGAPESNAYPSAYNEQRDNIPLVETPPPQQGVHYIPPEYDDPHREPFIESRAPSGPTLPRE